MDDEKRLTLEEITALVDKVDEWGGCFSLGARKGDGIKGYNHRNPIWMIEAYGPNFPFRPSVYVYSRKGHHSLGEVRGKNAILLYERIRALANIFYDEEKQRALKQTRETILR